MSLMSSMDEPLSLTKTQVAYDQDNFNILIAPAANCGTNIVAIGSGIDAVPSIKGACKKPIPPSVPLFPKRPIYHAPHLSRFSPFTEMSQLFNLLHTQLTSLHPRHISNLDYQLKIQHKNKQLHQEAHYNLNHENQHCNGRNPIKEP